MESSSSFPVSHSLNRTIQLSHLLDKHPKSSFDVANTPLCSEVKKDDIDLVNIFYFWLAPRILCLHFLILLIVSSLIVPYCYWVVLLISRCSCVTIMLPIFYVIGVLWIVLVVFSISLISGDKFFNIWDFLGSRTLPIIEKFKLLNWKGALKLVTFIIEVKYTKQNFTCPFGFTDTVATLICSKPFSTY